MIDSSSNGAVTTLVMNRPEKRNALNHELIDGLAAAIDAAVQSECRVVVLTGYGPVFSAGADLSGATYDTGFHDKLRAVLRKLETAPLVTIAAVNGAALGAGLQVAMACDLRVMASDATCGVPAAKIGVAVDEWTIRRLISYVGAGTARGMLVGCDQLGADAAVRLGFANRLGGLAVAQLWADEIATFAPLTLAHYKLVFTDDGAREEPSSHTEAMLRAWRSADVQEARVARSEKRAPVFRGV